MQNYKTDILIVGTGASGLFAALHCPIDKNILMIKIYFNEGMVQNEFKSRKI